MPLPSDKSLQFETPHRHGIEVFSWWIYRPEPDHTPNYETAVAMVESYSYQGSQEGSVELMVYLPSNRQEHSGVPGALQRVSVSTFWRMVDEGKLRRLDAEDEK